MYVIWFRVMVKAKRHYPIGVVRNATTLLSLHLRNGTCVPLTAPGTICRTRLGHDSRPGLAFGTRPFGLRQLKDSCVAQRRIAHGGCGCPTGRFIGHFRVLHICVHILHSVNGGCTAPKRSWAMHFLLYQD